MSFVVNSNKFWYTSLSAVAVISAVVLKNSLEQTHRSDHILNGIGQILFVLGWVGVAYSLAMSPGEARISSFTNTRTLAAFGGAASVVFAVFMMKKLTKEKKPMQMMYPTMFVAGWLAIAYAASLNRGKRLIALAAAGCVLASMMGTLPWQRKNCVVDGPGMPLFILGWMFLVYSVSV